VSSTIPLISSQARRARIGVRHRLAADCRATTPEEVAESLVALHATDAATVFLSVAARLTKPGHLETERALYEDRTLTRMHGMRQTMFVLPTALAPTVHASTTLEVGRRERASFLKTMAAGGYSAEWIASVEDAVVEELRRRGTATGAELGRAVPGMQEKVTTATGKTYEATVAIASRLLRNLGIAGRIVRDRPIGTWTSSQFRWAVFDGHDEESVEDAQALLVSRWLASYGPGTEADLKWWTGWKVTDVRRALKSAGAVEVALGGGGGKAGSDSRVGVGYVLAEDVEPAPPSAAPWAALLPGLDPTPMGWQDRSWFLEDEHRAALFDRSGNIGPTIWWNGEVVGGWAQGPDGRVATRLLRDIGSEGAAAVEAEAARWSEWVGDIRVTPRFRTPLERELVG
jgi:hypothetical protein